MGKNCEKTKKNREKMKKIWKILIGEMSIRQLVYGLLVNIAFGIDPFGETHSRFRL